MQSEPDPRRFETQWGPRGLETPATVSTEIPHLRFGLTVAALWLLTYGVPWCRQNFPDLDPRTVTRRCAAAPSEVSVWASPSRSRRRTDSGDLRKWISRHGGRINDQYGAFCD